MKFNIEIEMGKNCTCNNNCNCFSPNNNTRSNGNQQLGNSTGVEKKVIRLNRKQRRDIKFGRINNKEEKLCLRKKI